MQRTWVRIIAAPLLLALLVIGVQAFRKPLRDVFRDEFYYLTIARDLSLHGVFTNGTYKRGPFSRQPGPEHFGDESPAWAKPGRFFAPAYPMLVHIVQSLDAGLAVSVRCHVRYAQQPQQVDGNCARNFQSLVAVQVVLWAVTMLAIFHMALLLTRSETVAWLAMLIALATGEPGFYARAYLSENATVPAFCSFMLFAMRAVDRRRTTDFVAAGVTLALAALARPAYAYLFYLVVPLMLVAAHLLANRVGVPTLTQIGLFTLATLIVLAPWMLRNQTQFGDPALSAGYAEVILIQRLSYNQMTWGEWWVSWIYWLPDFGDSLARKLFRAELWNRLGWSEQTSYYFDGIGGPFTQRILAAAPDDKAVYPLLMKSYLLGDLFKHVLVSLPLSMRGLGVAKYLSIAGFVLFWPVLRRMQAEGRLTPFLILVLPPVLMAGLHGFVSVNIERYNLPMIAVYAIIVAVAANEALTRYRASRI